MYAKLFQTILFSSVWETPPTARLTWVTLLLMADRSGSVYASDKAIANMARLPLEDVQAALELFQKPDPESRTSFNDGKRIEEIEGGYWICNYAKYRAAKNADARRVQNMEAKQRERAKQHAEKNGVKLNVSDLSDLQPSTGTSPGSHTSNTPHA